MELVMNMIIVPFLQTYAACSLLAMNVNYDLTPDMASNCVNMISIPFLQMMHAVCLLCMSIIMISLLIWPPLDLSPD